MFLVPHVQLDWKSELASLPEVKSQSEKFEQINAEPIPREYFDTLNGHLAISNDVISAELYPEGTDHNCYHWTQDGDLITVTYESPQSISFDDVRINDSEIVSSFVTGSFYGSVKDFDIKVARNKITIQLQVDGKWPVLVSRPTDADDIDTESLFLLSVFSQRIHRNDIFERFLIDCAMRGHAIAISSLALHYTSTGKGDESFFLYAKHALESNDKVSAIIVAEVLLGNMNALDLCENMLISLAKDGLGVGFRYLGLMHLLEEEQFPSDASLAVKYFEVAAEEYQDMKSLDILGKCYIGGIGCEKNIDKGIKLMQRAGTVLPEKVQNAINEEQQKKESWVDKALAGAVTLGLATAGYFLVRSFLKRRK